MRILVVEDDLLIADALSIALRHSGHAVDVVGNVRDADSALSTDYALMLLDLGLPDGDGLEFLRRVRSRRQPLPVIVITARDRADDRVRGLDMGADDYVVKPFQLDELEARIRAVTRRAGAGTQADLSLGPLTLVREARRASLDGEPLELTAREYALLELFLLRQGRVVSKAQIEDQLCTWVDGLSDSAIEVMMHRLRKKLDGARGLSLKTLRGFGYLLSEDPAA